MAQIQIFTRTGCVICCCCLALLERKNVEFEVVEITTETTQQSQLLQQIGPPKLPAVFIGGVHIGSYRDLESLEANGNLDSLLEEFAVAIKPAF